MGMNNKVAVYNNQQDEGPYHVIVLNWDWWKTNWLDIAKWFDDNCPSIKPTKDQVLFKFESKEQYTMWRMVWDNF
jgi:hypothetical protein